jgi:hypothetical protein
MRFLRGLSFLGMIASLAFMVFQDSGLVEKFAHNKDKISGENSTNPKVSMVETIKTLQKMKNMREQMEADFFKECGNDCVIKSSWETTKRAPSQVKPMPPSHPESVSPVAQPVAVIEEPGAPALKVNYQPPDLGPQSLELIGGKDFKMLELSQNSLINFEIPSGLSRCQYKNPKGLIADCTEQKDFSTLRTVDQKDIGMHRFRFMINETVYEYRIQVVGIR